MSESYTLEYGQATVEVHTDAAAPGDHVLVIDDLIATGGTMLATTRLMQRLGAKLVEAAAVIDLPELGGSTRLEATGVKPFTLMSF
jgi:adenine phosphoribosyltransferase